MSGLRRRMRVFVHWTALRTTGAAMRTVPLARATLSHGHASKIASMFLPPRMRTPALGPAAWVGTRCLDHLFLWRPERLMRRDRRLSSQRHAVCLRSCLAQSTSTNWESGQVGSDVDAAAVAGGSEEHVSARWECHAADLNAGRVKRDEEPFRLHWQRVVSELQVHQVTRQGAQPEVLRWHLPVQRLVNGCVPDSSAVLDEVEVRCDSVLVFRVLCPSDFRAGPGAAAGPEPCLAFRAAQSLVNPNLERRCRFPGCGEPVFKARPEIRFEETQVTMLRRFGHTASNQKPRRIRAGSILSFGDMLPSKKCPAASGRLERSFGDDVQVPVWQLCGDGCYLQLDFGFVEVRACCAVLKHPGDAPHSRCDDAWAG